MYVDLCKYKRGNKTYKRVLLREGYREGGKVKHAHLLIFLIVVMKKLRPFGLPLR